MYPNSLYFGAKVYAISVHGPLGVDGRSVPHELHVLGEEAVIKELV